MSNKQWGELGETIASKYMEDKGYQLIASNWRTRLGELDLVMMSPSDLLVVVEVKLRTNDHMGSGLDAVDQRKIRKIYQMTEMFLLRNPKYRNFPVRIDVISIVYDKVLDTPPVIMHIEGVL